jgi:hypothetical protein
MFPFFSNNELILAGGMTSSNPEYLTIVEKYNIITGTRLQIQSQMKPFYFG